jgi:hypothetical protein
MQDNIGTEIANTAGRTQSCVEKRHKQMRGVLRSWRSALRDMYEIRELELQGNTAYELPT